jgi:regulator of protease activity HflC (stomatin/prohibitin superfamily)
VRSGAEAAMREVIGKSNLQYAQTEGRTRIEQDTKDLLQRILDEYGLGVRIAQVQLLRVDPPQEVIGAFRDVQAARADKEKNINEANTYRNQVLPRAKGEAETIIQRAEGYKAQKVASAKGDVQRFNQVYEQYAKAKDITSERLYLEAIEEVAAQREQADGRQERRHRRCRALPAAARAAAGRPADQLAAAANGAHSGAGRHAMTNRSIVLLVAAAIVVFLLTQTLYTVDPTKQVLVRQFGAIVGDPKTDPGLYAKIRWSRTSSASTAACSTTRPRSSRSSPATRSAWWSTPMPASRSSMPGCSPSACRAASRRCAGLLDSLINSEIRGVLSSVPLHAVLTEQRASLMDDITRRVNGKTKELGVEVVDVRIKRPTCRRPTPSRSTTA